MLNGVAPVAFKANPPIDAMTSAKDLINKPQTFAVPQKADNRLPAENAKKKGGFGKTLTKIVVGAALVAGALVGANKLGWLTKVPKVGTYMETAANFIETKSVAAYNWCKGYCIQGYNWIKTKLTSGAAGGTP